MILSQALATNLSKGPTKCALRFLGKDIQYKDLVTAVARFSYLFQKEIGANARVALIGSNCPAFVTAFFALTNNRSIVIPIDPALSDDDIGEWVYETRPTHIMVSSDFTNRARDLLRRRGISAPLIEIEKKRGGEYATEYVPPAEQVPNDKDPVLLLRTAGTAGTYKYALFNHLQIQAAVSGLKTGYRTAPGDCFLTTLSWAHPFALVHGMLFPILSGATSVIDHGLELADFLTFLSQSKVTRLIGFPAFFEKLLLTCRSFDRTLALKSITVSLGSLDAETSQGFSQMKIQVANCYGQTENLWSISMTDVQDTSPIPRGLSAYQYKVIDQTGDEVPGKERRQGQLAVTGGAIMMHYEPKNEKEDEATKTKKSTLSVLRGTWLYTGDVFEIEGSGSEIKLKFLQRKDGFNPVPKTDGFSPATIEKAVGKQKGIADVVALKLGAQGPIVCVIVQGEGSELTEHQVLETAGSALTPKNTPSKIFFLEEIPRAGDGQPDFSAIQKILIALPGGEKFAGQELVSAPPSPSLKNGEKVNEEVSAPKTEGTSKKYCEIPLKEVIKGEPLPGPIYLYLSERYVTFRAAGDVIDRHTYERLELKKVDNLFVLEAHREAFKLWSQSVNAKLSPALREEMKNLNAIREDAHRKTLDIFQSQHPEKVIAAALNVSKKLVTEVMKFPFAISPLARLQNYSRGIADHSVNVSVLSVYLAMQMGYSSKVILQHVGMGGLLHDVGKTQIDFKDDDDVATRNRKIQAHPEAGVKLLELDRNVPDEVKKIVAQHHECHNGSGFPTKVHGSNVYDLAQIVSIANVFDELVGEGRGTLVERQRAAIQSLDDQSQKFDPQKLEKVLKILQLGI
jgi:putative nucleotidyltransferase with HDIG domain